MSGDLEGTGGFPASDEAIDQQRFRKYYASQVLDGIVESSRKEIAFGGLTLRKLIRFIDREAARLRAESGF